MSPIIYSSDGHLGRSKSIDNGFVFRCVNVTRLIAGILVGVALVAAAGFSYAEPPAKLEKSEKVQEALEIITMWKMMGALNLDKATADKILQIRHEFLAKRKAFHQSLAQDIKALKQRLSKTTAPDDKELAQLIADVRNKRKKLMGFWNQQYDQVSKLLTIRQQAELVIFLKENHRELRAILHPERCIGEMPPRRNHEPHRIVQPHDAPPIPPSSDGASRPN
jgi:hypothetical protein